MVEIARGLSYKRPFGKKNPIHWLDFVIYIPVHFYFSEPISGYKTREEYLKCFDSGTPSSRCSRLKKITSFIYERKVVRKILYHLGLSEEAKSKRERAPPSSPNIVETITESYDGGWPDYEEPFTDVQTQRLHGAGKCRHKNTWLKQYDIKRLIYL